MYTFFCPLSHCVICRDRAVNAESPTFLALGGIPDIQEVFNRLSVYDFVGCIGHVVVNGYLLDVAMPTKSNALESGCAMQTIPPTSAPLLDSSCVVCEGVDVGICDYVLGRVPQACSQGEMALPQPVRVHVLDSWQLG